MTLAHQVVVMNGGRIEQVGTPAEVYLRPASEFVARFIGSPEMNVIDVDDARGSLGLIEALAGVRRIGVRPEDVQPAAEVPSGAVALRFDARIEMVELTGSQALVTLMVGERRLNALVASRESAALNEGAAARFAVTNAAVIGFDADGRRVDL